MIDMISTQTRVDPEYFITRTQKDHCISGACVLPPHSGDCIYFSTHPSGFHTSWKKSRKSSLTDYQKSLLKKLGITKTNRNKWASKSGMF